MKFMNDVLNFKMMSSAVNQQDAKQKNRNVLLLSFIAASILATGFFTASSSSTTFTKTKGCQCTSAYCMCGTNCPCGNQCNCR